MRASTAVILAAGEGTRMRSSLPKVVHEVAGRSMVGHVVHAARTAGATHIVVVVGFKQERVREALAHEDVTFAVQEQQLGTGHAVACARDVLQGNQESAFVLNGDGPLMTAETLSALAAMHYGGERPGAGVTMATVTLEDPTGMGRIVRDENGSFAMITEEADADEVTRRIKEIYPGTMMIGPDAWDRLATLGRDNAQGEVYLTDLPQATLRDGEPVRTYVIEDPRETYAANDRVELARLEAIMQERLRTAWMRAGVTMNAPLTVYLHDDVMLARDVTLEPGVVLMRGTAVAERATIGAGSVLSDCRVDAGVHVPPATVAEGITFT